jgi:hypothetical protein
MVTVGTAVASRPLGLGGKFQAKSGGWDENRTFLEGDVLEIAVRNGAGC